MRLLWLPEVLRAADLQVAEVDGWRTRGSDQFDPAGLICHATAGSRSATDQGEINVLLNGSSTAPPPIAQLYLSRTGTWYVVASGRCNHALTGWAGPLVGLGNSRLVGVEAANDNRGEPWPAAQADAYVRGVAAVCRRMGWAAARVAGHKEHQPAGYGKASTKTDPTFDMGAFRAQVGRYLTGVPAGEDDDMGSWTEPLTQGAPGYAGHQRDTALAFAWQQASEAAEGVAKLLAATAEERARDAGMRSAVEALAQAIGAAGGSVDTAAILAGVDLAVARAVAPLLAELASARQETALLREQLADRDARLAAALDPPTGD